MRSAKYLRFSSKDEDLRNGEKDESESISNQRSLLREYVSGHAELAGSEILEFCDDGWSGTNFERHAVKAHLEQVWRGHASISFAALKADQGNVFIPQIVGRHHGVPPKESYTASCNAYGGDAWQKRREDLLALIMGERGWPAVSSKTQALLLMGLPRRQRHSLSPCRA